MINNKSSNPYEEAMLIFCEVLQELSKNPSDIPNDLRKCQHACVLLGWEDQKNWFHQEINGYQPGFAPSYRKITGKKVWENVISGLSNSTYVEEKVYGRDASIYDEEPDNLEVFADIDWILQASTFGYEEKTELTKNAISPSGRKSIILTRVRVFLKESFISILNQIKNKSFDFASSAYSQLKYSNQINTYWNDYRQKVDSKLSVLNFNNHLDAINRNIQSSNPEDWRSAVYGCRSLLRDLASFLWKDSRKTYSHLPGGGENNTLEVNQEKIGNRLAAYLHQKGITGKKGKYFRKEAEKIAESIIALISYQSEAHEPIERIDAISIVIGTYLLIGELINRTDFEPVVQYNK